MKTIAAVTIHWHIDLPINRTGIFQIIGHVLQLHLRMGADANIALAYLRPKLAAIGWVLPKDAPLSAVPSPVMACHDAFGGDDNGT